MVELPRQSGIRAYICPITITAGHKATADGQGTWLVPKKELVSTLQVLLQSGRIKVAPALPEAQTLVREFLNFQVKITPAAHETFGAWREGEHDDLVLAVALGVWLAERIPEPYTGPLVYWPPVDVADDCAAGNRSPLEEILARLEREDEIQDSWPL